MFTFFGTETTDKTSQLVPSSTLPVNDFSVEIISSVSTSDFLHWTKSKEVVIANARMNNFFMMLWFWVLSNLSFWLFDVTKVWVLFSDFYDLYPSWKWSESIFKFFYFLNQNRPKQLTKNVLWKILILIFNRYLIPVSIIDDTKIGPCEPHFNDRKPNAEWPASVF